MEKLLEKEQKLNARKRELESSIEELKQSLNEQNFEEVAGTIKARAEQVQSLNAELELIQLLVQNAQEKLRARQEYESSKEYKDKRKMQEKLTGEAESKAGEVFEKLLEVQNAIFQVEELARQADKIHLELALDKQEAVWSTLEKRELYRWLSALKGFIDLKKVEMRRMREGGQIKA